jgi:hypothetical protein
MSAALCLHCGKIKHGAFVDCPKCSAPAFEDNNLNLAFTDHFLDTSTLEDFGRAIQHINALAPDEESALMSFLQLISERHPEIVYNVTTHELAEKAGAVLHLGNVPEITITDSVRASQESPDMAERFSLCKVLHRKMACTKCGQIQSVAVWQRINGGGDPAAMALLLGGLPFDCSCRKCGHKQTIAYEALYLNYGAGVAIWFKPKKSDVEVPAVEIPEAALLCEVQSSFRMRIVTTALDFIEKVRMLEDGWDDAAIEFQKLRLCIANNIDVSAPPAYAGTVDDSRGTNAIFDGGSPILCPALEVVAATAPTLSKLREHGHLAEGDWREVSVASILRALELSGIFRALDPPGD